MVGIAARKPRVRWKKPVLAGWSGGVWTVKRRRPFGSSSSSVRLAGNIIRPPQRWLAT